MKSTERWEPTCSSRSCQKSMLPTADLMPTGRPVASAIVSTKSSMLSTSLNSVCRDGLEQSWPIGMPRISEISRLILAAGNMPPSPGLAPWLSLISIAFTGAEATTSLSRARSKRPSRHGSEVGGADLEDQVATLPVMWREGTLAGVVQGAGQRGALVERLDRGTRQRAEAHRRDVDHRVGPEAWVRPRGPPITLAEGNASSSPLCTSVCGATSENVRCRMIG